MSIIIKLQGLPLEASSVDVRRYLLGLTIPDGGVHIVGGDDGTVFIEFASDEDARQAMARGDGQIKNSNIRLLLSSRTEMQSVVEAARQKQQQANLQHLQQQTQPQIRPFDGDPRLFSTNYIGMINQQPPPCPVNYLGMVNQIPLMNFQQPQQQQPQQQQPQQQLHQQQPPQQLLLIPDNRTMMPDNRPMLHDNRAVGMLPDNRARMSGMRGGDDKLFANKKCVLAASNIPYRATSKDIIDFLAEFNINEDCIRRRYNQKGQPTADAKIAFPTPDAAMKALKTMNKKNLCGRPVFLKPV